MTDAATNAGQVHHIDVRALPPAERHPRIFGTLHTLTPGGMLRHACV